MLVQIIYIFDDLILYFQLSQFKLFRFPTKHENKNTVDMISINVYRHVFITIWYVCKKNINEKKRVHGITCIDYVNA